MATNVLFKAFVLYLFHLIYFAVRFFLFGCKLFGHAAQMFGKKTGSISSSIRNCDDLFLANRTYQDLVYFWFLPHFIHLERHWV